MINRILIRIKVIQMLYSFMLTRSDFRIQEIPSKKTRDSKFAYAMYLDTLLLILKLSGRKISPKDEIPNPSGASAIPAIQNAKMITSLAANSELQEFAMKYSRDLSNYADCLEYLTNEICSSSVAKDYAKKRKRAIADDVNFWAIVIETILLHDPKFIEAARKDDDFTISGFETGLQMAINTLRDFNDVKSALLNSRRSLQESLEQAYKLYVALLLLPKDITRLREEQIETAKDKYLPTADDLNPNLKFINNKLINEIATSESLNAYLKDNPFSWDNDYYLIKELLETIINSDIYKEYMSIKGSDLQSDCEFWRTLFKDVILPSEALSESLESRSVYWNDDISIVGTFVLKTLRRIATDDSHKLELMPMFKDDEDATFGENLFVNAIDNADSYRELIDKFINESQWDTERIALMDIVILTAAITELLHFPAIPVPVTLNEYIEIANYYSSPRSGQFINGVLYSVINYLKGNNQLHKSFENKK